MKIIIHFLYVWLQAFAVFAVLFTAIMGIGTFAVHFVAWTQPELGPLLWITRVSLCAAVLMALWYTVNKGGGYHDWAHK